MTLIEMQYKAANERLEASLQGRDAERAEMRQFLKRIRTLLADKETARNHILMEVEHEMAERNIVW